MSSDYLVMTPFEPAAEISWHFESQKYDYMPNDPFRDFHQMKMETTKRHTRDIKGGRICSISK